MKRNDKPITVVIPGDLHLTQSGLPNHQASLWVVDEINHLIRPDFVQFIGDNVQDATDEQFTLFKDLTDRIQVPWYALVGDHDVQRDTKATCFRKHIGNTYGALSLGGYRFLRLNTQESRPVGLSDEQLRWFLAEVDKALVANERVVIFQHNYPYQIWEDYSGQGIDGWREIVQTRQIHGIITGHTHYWQMANDGRNALVTTRSIADPEGGPPGYTIAAFHGEDFAVSFRSITDHSPLVLITHPREAILATGPAHVVKSRDEVRVQVWSHKQIDQVRYCINDGPCIPLKRCDSGLWSAPLIADRLRKGVHRLLVRAEGEGSAGEQRIDFVVDPTGRYTAIPMVSPSVSETNFC